MLTSNFDYHQKSSEGNFAISVGHFCPMAFNASLPNWKIYDDYPIYFSKTGLELTHQFPLNILNKLNRTQETELD